MLVDKFCQSSCPIFAVSVELCHFCHLCQLLPNFRQCWPQLTNWRCLCWLTNLTRFLALFLRPFLILRRFPFHSPRPSSSPTSSSSPRPFPFSSPSSFTSPSSFSLFLPFVLSLPLFLYPFGITAHPCPFSRQVDFVVWSRVFFPFASSWDLLRFPEERKNIPHLTLSL